MTKKERIAPQPNSLDSEEFMSHNTLSGPDIAPVAIDHTGDVVTDFVAAAHDLPGHAALVYNGSVITYGDLAARVRSTASRYRSIRPDAGGGSGRIGAVVSHTPAVVEHLFGILQAGVTYCPIDSALPGARKHSLAAALGVDRVIIADLDGGGSDNRGFDVSDSPAVVEGDLSGPTWLPDDPAYVLCTSGSTGTPKPVAISRHALTVTARALRDLFELTPDDRVLQFASLGWDTCLEEMVPALITGATVVFDDAAHIGSFRPFVRMLAEQAITMIDLPTAYWHELVLYLHEEQIGLPGSLRLVVIGGERVDPTRLRQWRELPVGNVVLLNTYGCTETTMVTHAVRLSGPGAEPEVMALTSDAPIGRPLPHVRDHITDDGELLVSGPSLATGYLGMPEHTASGFPVADHGTGPARWFRTGDLASRSGTGPVFSRGRADDQLKVLGVRVHPAEVEAQLTTHPAVAGAVVVGELLLGRMSLTAYVVPAAGTLPTPRELKRFLRERLPSQFVPARVYFVSGLEYTASGKIDRSATQRAALNGDLEGAER
ncbi:AMP-binding protein [Rhodococcus sp. HNM0563]|uniref:AMP-binding protein n=1 Tax=Rhodococcus sp. HNM0563 TaxID=2716339 RepID=UPI001F0E578F|nr:AMP-binding protein [Rhodococcus sp. HNM0563]